MFFKADLQSYDVAKKKLPKRKTFLEYRIILLPYMILHFFLCNKKINNNFVSFRR